MAKRITQEKIDEIIRLRESGMTIDAIMDEARCSMSTVRKYSDTAPDAPRIKMTQERIDRIIELRKSGVSEQATAEMVGCSVSSVSTYARGFGTTRNYSDEQRAKCDSMIREGLGNMEISEATGMKTRAISSRRTRMKQRDGRPVRGDNGHRASMNATLLPILSILAQKELREYIEGIKERSPERMATYGAMA